jgi:ubiquinone/menaquinone biosynthesis C-methylase UbiE
LSEVTDVRAEKATLGVFSRVGDIVEREHGYGLFALYGTLRAALDGAPPDISELQAGYVSKQDDGIATAEELKDLAFALIDEGLVVEGHRNHIRVSDDGGDSVDVFHLFFDATGALHLPSAGAAGLTRADWTGVVAGPDGIDVPVAGDQLPEAPDSAAVAEGSLPDALVEEIYWANFYAHAEYDTGSTFFEKVNAADGMPDTVIDLGCGDGRDSYAFGKAGRKVLGLDRSHIGVRHATQKAHDLGHGATVSFSACDVGDAAHLQAILTDAIAKADGGPVVFYARFFLHSIPEDVQATMMRTIREVARPGDYFAAEFRTDKDEKNAKVHTKHYRRFQNGPAFGEALDREYGFTIVEEQEGTGLSPYKGEDPELYRVIARREN